MKTAGYEATTGLHPWYSSFLRRNPPKHLPTPRLRQVRPSHSSTSLRPWSSAKADKQGGKPFCSLFLALCIFHLLYATSSSWAGIVVQACFSPKGKCSNHIIRELQRAEREIFVAVYAFTSREIARVLVQAKQRGIHVRVLLDRKFDRENKYSKGSFLKKEGLKVRRASGLRNGKKRRGLMHQKFVVIDRRIVLTGSYNWTASADRFNHENLLLFREAGPLAEEYRQQFLRLWEKGR